MSDDIFSLEDRECGIIGKYYHAYDIIYLAGLLIEDYEAGILDKKRIEKRFGVKK